MPSRVEFYDPWLNPATPRGGHSGLAPLAAALSFLRREGDSYAAVSTRAGEYTAEWTVAGLSPLRRRMIAAAPRGLRARFVTRLADGLAQRTHGSARLRTRWRRGRGTVRLEHSLFCDVRQPVEAPLCQFYASALGRLLALLELEAEVTTAGCRATGSDACVMSIVVRSSRGEQR